MNAKKEFTPGNVSYKRPVLMFSKHLETIYPSLIRSVNKPEYHRERITTPDDDFLDLDRVKNNNPKVVIISHGLEGSADRPYVKGMARIFADHNYDVVAWNFRGCSGEMNRKLRFYHSGATEDLHTVINHVKNEYDEINLIGFSLGGNLTLKYLGEEHGISIHKAIVFSVPLHLHDACVQISKPSNFLYSRRFLRHLKAKVVQKKKNMTI